MFKSQQTFISQTEDNDYFFENEKLPIIKLNVNKVSTNILNLK